MGWASKHHRFGTWTEMMASIASSRHGYVNGRISTSVQWVSFRGSGELRDTWSANAVNAWWS
ncbi:hypothetical protein Pd630_LPD03586 [Rhodococcus opacus PD630]|nr:hypothetical protein Pd630_LPD03586 [Rhodococcus opacus PD630]